MTKIQVAYIHDGQNVGFNFYQSMRSLDYTDLMPNDISVRANTMGLVDARNQITQYFLDSTDADYLWWIDSDMGFAPDTPQRLAKHGLDCVGARTYGVTATAVDGMGGFKTKQFLVAYYMYQQDDGYLHFSPIQEIFPDYEPDAGEAPLPNKTEVITHKPIIEDSEDDDEEQNSDPYDGIQNRLKHLADNAGVSVADIIDPVTRVHPISLEPQGDKDGSLIQVAGTGTGCLLVSRKALVKVREEFGDVWFDQVSYPAREGKSARMKVSEDLSFCYRLGVVGIPVYIDLNVRTNHMKTIWASGQ